ncbi:MAG: YggT family protein [Chloroflexi bacterium]|nr:YggT family protein [Chloroflexota bacterium]
MGLLIIIVNATVRVLVLAVFVYSLLRYFLDPFHPVIDTLGRIVDPLLKPIRKYVSPVGGMDFSPLILMIALQVVGAIIVALLRSFQ